MISNANEAIWRVFYSCGWVCGLGVAASALAQMPPVPVLVDTARTMQVQEHRLVTGELRAMHRSQVATREPGLVLEAPIQQGHLIQQGGTMARIDSSRLEIELGQVQANVEVAAATAQERRVEAQWRLRDLENLRELSRGGASNPKELYDAQFQSALADARLAAAERQIAVFRAQAELLRKRIADMTIVAPFEGVIVSRMAEPGQWLGEGAVVAEIISVGTIEAWLDVPQQYADAVIGGAGFGADLGSASMRVRIEAINAEQQASGLRAVPLVDLKGRSFTLIARLQDRRHLLAPGMSVTAWVPTGDLADHMTVPKNALLRSDVGTYVYVVRQASGSNPSAAQPSNDAPAKADAGSAPAPPPATVVPVDVQVLFSVEDRFVVRAAGLLDGAEVVVEGNERLFPSAPIKPSPVAVRSSGRAPGAGTE